MELVPAHSSQLFNYLIQATPTEDTDILDFIAKRNLPIFVDSQGTVHYKNIANNDDPSFRRSLQEVVAMVFKRTEEHVKSQPIDEATYESFESKAGNETRIQLSKVEANQKVEDLLNNMIDRNASDLHIKLQSQADLTTIRMRINGELISTGSLTYAVGDALLRSMWLNYANISRIESSINNSSCYFKPKNNPDREYMVRMTEMPEVRGTMFVARIRDPHEIRALEDIGYNMQQMAVIENLLGHRKGLASINGPTNSGKSSTQSTMLSLMPASMHIVEIGDPVETYQPHIAHVELKDSHKAGKAGHLEDLLGATVRQDPDILALTEMRDALTAKAALQLASQGKFVLTTMHTTDFVSCFERLQRMGLTKEDMVAPGFLRGLVCQKLLPKLCECAVDSSEVPNETQKYAYLLGDEKNTIQYRRTGGCSTCHNTGIIDRILVAEAVEITTELLPIIREILYQSNPIPFYEYAEKQGILNIHQHARERVLAGEVDPSIAETELGRFGKENLLWQYPKPRTNS